MAPRALRTIAPGVPPDTRTAAPRTAATTRGGDKSAPEGDDCASDCEAGFAPGGDRAPAGSTLITEVQRAVQAPRGARRSARALRGGYSGERLQGLFERMVSTRRPPERAALAPLRRTDGG
jgi:hypothetical protein